MWDPVTYNMNFQKSIKPYVITLQRETPSPFLPPPALEDGSEEECGKKGEEAPEVRIDLAGIQDRVLGFPLPEGMYTQLAAIKGKVLYTFQSDKKSGESEEGEEDEKEDAGGELRVYEFATLKAEKLHSGIHHFQLSADRNWMAYTCGKRLRIIKVGEKPEETDHSYRTGGWLDWGRVRLPVNPPREWQHMFDEAWRLQKELFWREDMSHVDWEEVYQRYRPLVSRIATAQELMELIGEMQGELGSSHAYVSCAESAAGPDYAMGHLGAEFDFEEAQGGLSYHPPLSGRRLKSPPGERVADNACPATFQIKSPSWTFIPGRSNGLPLLRPEMEI